MRNEGCFILLVIIVGIAILSSDGCGKRTAEEKAQLDRIEQTQLEILQKLRSKPAAD